jgi:hypothetical protein
VHLEDSRVRTRERGQLATEGIAAFTLLSAVQQSYARGGVDPFVILNATAGVALAAAVIIGVIKLRRHRYTNRKAGASSVSLAASPHSRKEVRIITIRSAARVLPMARLLNRAEVRDVLLAAAHARDVTVTT